MISLSNLKNTHRPTRNVQRVGRGNGSKRGKTCCRGHKGDKSRSGYKRRYGHEGGQLPLYKKLPSRGFSNARFKSKIFIMNLSDIQEYFHDGDKVCMDTLIDMRIATPAYTGGLKILSLGELTKKVEIEANSISKAAEEKLKANNIQYKIV